MGKIVPQIPGSESTSLRKQPTFCNATTGFPWEVRSEDNCRNSVVITCLYPDLGHASDWLRQVSLAAWPFRSSTQIWEVTHHQYWILCTCVSDVISLGKKWIKTEVEFLRDQHAKKIVSDGPGLVDFTFRLVNSVLNFPNGQVNFWGKFKLQKDCNQSC